MSEEYIQLPPDGTGKKVRAIRRPDNRYEEVMVPFSKDGEIDLRKLHDKLDNPEDPQTVQLLHAGAQIDPTVIRDIEKVAEVIKYLAPTALGAGGTATIWTPAVGKKARPKLVSVSVDARTRIELRWGTTPFESHYLPADGNIIFNLIGANDEGAIDEPLTLLSSEAVTVTATARGDEV